MRILPDHAKMLRTGYEAKKTLIVMSFCFLAVACLAQVAPQAVAETMQQEHVAQQNLDDLNQAERDIRDPFWPIGYYPEWWKKTADVQLPERVQKDCWAEAKKLIKVSGMSKMGGTYYTVINGRTITAEDVVSVEYEGSVYQWVVSNIDQRGVRLSEKDEQAISTARK